MAAMGLVAARILSQCGLHVDVFYCFDPERIKGDAALALNKLGSGAAVVQKINSGIYDLVIDAVFGAGLDRDVKGDVADVIGEISRSNVPVLAVDLPSGIDGDTGCVRGVAVRADATVTFFRNKPGHVLYPGRGYCGLVYLHQIGIRSAVLQKTGYTATLNEPDLWRSTFPSFGPQDHKYAKGHALVVSGPLAMSGASRLAARAALRTGSGLVTLASSKKVLRANATQMSSVMLRAARNGDDLVNILTDPRINTIVIGPGMKPNFTTRTKVLAILACDRHHRA